MAQSIDLARANAAALNTARIVTSATQLVGGSLARPHQALKIWYVTIPSSSTCRLKPLLHADNICRQHKPYSFSQSNPLTSLKYTLTPRLTP